MSTPEAAHAVLALALAEQIRPLLAGKGPDIQGAALAELTSIWLAGHPEEARAGMLAMHVDFIRQLTEINARFPDELIAAPAPPVGQA